MRKTYHIEARWDPEARVWVSHSDVPGLVIETATLAEFEAIMGDLAHEMLSDNHALAGASVEWTATRKFDLEAD
jgi:hypothetical protein